MHKCRKIRLSNDNNNDRHEEQIGTYTSYVSGHEGITSQHLSTGSILDRSINWLTKPPRPALHYAIEVRRTFLFHGVREGSRSRKDRASRIDLFVFYATSGHAGKTSRMLSFECSHRDEATAAISLRDLRVRPFFSQLASAA